jgi:hypothetical protein
MQGKIILSKERHRSKSNNSYYIQVSKQLFFAVVLMYNSNLSTIIFMA